MTQTLCPYSTVPLTEIEKVNNEHVLPLALGAPGNFTIPADANENNKMNEIIDAPAINEPLIRFLAMSQGVSSRSGPVEAILSGTVQGSGEVVRTGFKKGGLDIKFANPVEVDGQDRVTSVRGFGKAAAKLADKVKGNYARKGINVELGPIHTIERPSLKLDMSCDMNLLRQEMVKIAYLMTVRVFGDQAILSESGAIYRKAMMAKTGEEIKNIGIRGSTFQPLPLGFGSAKSNQHLLTCCFMPNQGIVSAVTLFGSLHGLFITPAHGFTQEEATGEVVMIDASRGTLTSRTYLDALVELCRNDEVTLQ